MSKTYDLTEWDRLGYVQEAHEEAGYLVQLLEDAGMDHALGVARALRERISLRVSDLMDGGGDQS